MRAHIDICDVFVGVFFLNVEEESGDKKNIKIEQALKSLFFV